MQNAFGLGGVEEGFAVGAMDIDGLNEGLCETVGAGLSVGDAVAHSQSSRVLPKLFFQSLSHMPWSPNSTS